MGSFFGWLGKVVRGAIGRVGSLFRGAPQPVLPGSIVSRRSTVFSPRGAEAETVGPGSPNVIMLGGHAYPLLEKLGSTRFASVWRTLAPLDFPAALKIIHRPGGPADPAGSSWSADEKKALASIKDLNHPHLLRTTAAWSLPDSLVILMELAEQTLQTRFDQCRRDGQPGIPAEELLGYMEETARALDYLHGKNLLHRDIKPNNVLLCGGHARIGDFGLILDERQTGSVDSQAGTRPYMAPEVWNRYPSRASDQYALAVTYVQMRSGRFPIDVPAGAPMEYFEQAHLHEPPDLSIVSRRERGVLGRALAKDPAKRYDNCTAFVQALGRALRPRNPLRWVVLAGAVLVLAALAWLVFRPASSPWTPPGFVAAEGAAERVVSTTARRCYTRIRRAKSSAGEVVLILLAHQTDHPFYLMQNKVWNDLFEDFATECPNRLDPHSQWRRGSKTRGRTIDPHTDGKLPVLRVTHREARQFAAWLGGRLPTPEELDIGAGYRDGPAAAPASFGTRQAEPRPVALPGELMRAADRSPEEIVDLLSNGYEWTAQTDRMPWGVRAREVAILRGRSFTAARPVSYEDLRDRREKSSNLFLVQDVGYASPSTGFRVVIDVLR
jgi:hypothetical protein